MVLLFVVPFNLHGVELDDDETYVISGAVHAVP